MGRHDDRAIVIGAGMAGLLAARVLADRVANVTIIERDELPEGAASRKGVPQGRHAHALLTSGRRVLEDLFPGLVDELLAGGAMLLRPEEARAWQYGGYRIVP